MTHYIDIENETDMYADLSLIHYWLLENLPQNTKFPTVRNRMQINENKRPQSIHLGAKRWNGEYIEGGCIGNARYPELYQMCTDFFNTYFPKHRWNQILINKNNKFTWHVDDNKTRGNVIVSFGDFTGGELQIQPESPCGVDGCIFYDIYDICMRPIWFDGKFPHQVAPIYGNRFSITAYSI